MQILNVEILNVIYLKFRFEEVDNFPKLVNLRRTLVTVKCIQFCHFSVLITLEITFLIRLLLKFELSRAFHFVISFLNQFYAIARNLIYHFSFVFYTEMFFSCQSASK